MEESQNSVAQGQISDNSQPINTVVDVVEIPHHPAVVAVVDGGCELGSGGKRKRGRPSRVPGPPLPVKVKAKPPVAVKKIKQEEEEEDVCFICFDGGSLVLCDHRYLFIFVMLYLICMRSLVSLNESFVVSFSGRGCPKAYHPACIKRDEEFFESAAKWNCGIFHTLIVCFS